MQYFDSRFNHTEIKQLNSFILKSTRFRGLYLKLVGDLDYTDINRKNLFDTNVQKLIQFWFVCV